jgi:hypothetical protein
MFDIRYLRRGEGCHIMGAASAACSTMIGKMDAKKEQEQEEKEIAER